MLTTIDPYLLARKAKQMNSTEQKNKFMNRTGSLSLESLSNSSDNVSVFSFSLLFCIVSALVLVGMLTAKQSKFLFNSLLVNMITFANYTDVFFMMRLTFHIRRIGNWKALTMEEKTNKCYL